MKYIKQYKDFSPVFEKLVYEGGAKKPYKKKQTKDDLKRVGYLEMVSVPGIGDFVAKFDTGNGSISSISCDDWKEFDGWIDWTLNGVKTHSRKTGVSTVFNKNNEKRVCVALTVEFDGKTYKDVPFALIDRSKNYAKMLVNRTFINTCHAMVDTSAPFIVTKRPKDFSVNKKSKYSGIYFYENDEEE